MSEKEAKAKCELLLRCGVCGEYMVGATNTRCEHTFCGECIEEYLLCIDECPACLRPLREERLASNIVLDNIISEYLQKHKPELTPAFNERKTAYRALRAARTLTDVEVGRKLDVRDQNYVWRTGVITREVNKERKVKTYIIKYDRANMKEEIPAGSPRLAQLHSYTLRKDIPYYHKKRICINDAEGNVYFVPTSF